ncbi:MAG TPA: hypothetical protein VGR07_01315, partial [Thermoanaerobaculia bacterium]|nr:hypothetical protein [Thermoanaerobaculia bacterium]
TSDGPLCLEQVCVTPDPEGGQIVRPEEQTAHQQGELAHWQAVGAIFAPNSFYKLTIETHLDLLPTSPDLDELPSYRNAIESAYFRTAGPPGLTTLAPPAGISTSPFATGLEDLTRYVKETEPPTVPPPGEKPILFKPFYRAYDVGLEFNEDYVEEMYRLDRRDLGLYLFDASNQPARDSRGRLLALVGSWGTAETLQLSERETRWLTLLDAATCLPKKLDPQTFPKDSTLTSAEERVLAADTLYEARLVPLLLHEVFTAGEVGHPPPGWFAQDDGPGGPSGWKLGESGEPPDRYVEQTSALGSSVEPDRPGTLLLLADTDPANPPGAWSDYRVSVYARSAGGGSGGNAGSSGSVGLVVRWSGPASWYRFALGERGRTLVKAGLGGIVLLASDSTSYQRNRDYLLSVEAIGGTLRAYVDGLPVFEVTDSDGIASRAGRAGLYTCQSPRARFRDLRVDDFRPAAPAVYRFQLTTSLYANFFHHLQSFDDQIWSGALGSADSLAFAEPLSFAPPGEAETRAYEALAGLALGPAPALQRSARVEVTRLTRPGGGPVLLLRSPEPLGWERLELALSRPAHPLSTPSRPGDLKLTDVAFGTLKPSEEAVTVLCREAASPTRSRIDLRALPGPVVELAGDPFLLLESFADPAALTRFEIVDRGPVGGPSAWLVEGGALLERSGIGGGTEPDLPGSLAVAGDPAWADYRLAVDLRSEAGGSLGIVCRYVDADNYYRLSADATLRFRRLVKVEAEAITILWEDAGRYTPGEPFRLEIEVVGPRLTAYQDGTRLVTVTDAAHPTGRAGLYVANDATARATLLAVRLPSLDGQALLADTFAAGDLGGWTLLSEVPGVPLAQSAAWETAGAALHLRSLLANSGPGDPAFPGALAAAGDPTWTDVLVHLRLRSKGGAIGLVFRGQDLANYYRFAMSRERGYRQLIRKAGGVPQVLWQDDVPHEVDRPYALTVAAVGPSLRGWLDGVPLFAVEDSALASGRIALYAWSNPEAWFSEVRVWPATLGYAGWWLDEGFAAPVPGRFAFLGEDGAADPLAWTIGSWTLQAEPEPTVWDTPAGGVDGAVYALALAGGDLYVGGNLTHAGGVPANRVARWSGGAWTPLGSGVDGPVRALAVDGDRLYVGGLFGHAGGVAATNVAVWNRTAGTWAALGSGINGPVLALAVLGGKLYAGGDFSQAGGVAAAHLAVWDPAAGTWAALGGPGGGVDNRVEALAVRGSSLFVGGRFSTAQGQPASRVAVWTGTAWVAASGAIDGPVSAIVVGEAGQGIYIGGGFTHAGGVAAARVARWTGSAWAPVGAGVDGGPVAALALDGNQLWVAGGFTTAGGKPANRLARYSLASRTWSPVGAVLPGPVLALAPAGDRLWAGGSFVSSVGPGVVQRLAALPLGGTRFVLINPPAPADFRLAVRLAPGADGAAAVVLRYVDATHHLVLWLDAERGQRRLVQTAGAPAEILWQDAFRSVAAREYAVTLDVLGDRLRGAIDGVPLFDLALAPAGSTAFQVGVAVRRSPDTRFREVRLAEPAWSCWYALGEEHLLAGTRLRIHATLPAPAAPPEPGVTLRSVALAGESGRLRLDPGGAELRLVAADGTPGHSRTFLGPAAYTPVSFQVLRKADATGLFLLPAGDAGAGALRLTLTYHRDRQEAGRPFHQAGDASPE